MELYQVAVVLLVQKEVYLLFIVEPLFPVLFQQCPAGNCDAVVPAVSPLIRAVIGGKAAVLLQPPQHRIQGGF